MYRQNPCQCLKEKKSLNQSEDLLNSSMVTMIFKEKKFQCLIHLIHKITIPTFSSYIGLGNLKSVVPVEVTWGEVNNSLWATVQASWKIIQYRKVSKSISSNQSTLIQRPFCTSTPNFLWIWHVLFSIACRSLSFNFKIQRKKGSVKEVSRVDTITYYYIS